LYGLYEYIGVGIISTAAFAVIVALIIIASEEGVKTEPHKRQIRLPKPQPKIPSYGKAYTPKKTLSLDISYETSTKKQPTILYHGTTVNNALEIYKTKLWLIGKSKPAAVWMGNRIDIAKKYSGTGKNAGIVVVKVDKDLSLNERGKGVFILEIPGAKPNEEYHQVEGLTPIDVIKPSGKSILHNII
jgi:hypothetical protein